MADLATATDPDQALAELLDKLRNWLDREERGGATVVRIKHVRAFFGWTR